MKMITMLELRRESSAVLGRLSKGERLVLSHRGKPVARIEPIGTACEDATGDDPFLGVGSRALPSPKSQTRHQDIDAILYGGR